MQKPNWSDTWTLLLAPIIAGIAKAVYEAIQNGDPNQFAENPDAWLASVFAASSAGAIVFLKAKGPDIFAKLFFGRPPEQQLQVEVREAAAAGVPTQATVDIAPTGVATPADDQPTT